MDFGKLEKALKKAKRVLISTHVLPDGDGLGAETALYHYLRACDRECQVFNPSPVPRRYQFLDPQGEFLHCPDLKTEPDLDPGSEKFDLWLILDTNDPRRLGALWQKFQNQTKQIIFFDHHTEMTGVAEIEIPDHALVIVDSTSSSIGELLFLLFNKLRLAPLNQQIAQGLYVSVMTDTNSFRTSNTTPLAHQIAGEMIQFGVNPEEVYQAIYSSKEVSHIQLLGHLLQNVQSTADQKIAWISMDLAIRKKYHASADDTLSFLNFLLLIRDAELICFFREEENQIVRVSIKSKGRIPVNRVAIALGGGGHKFAAGASLNLPLNRAIELVVKKLEALLL